MRQRALRLALAAQLRRAALDGGGDGDLAAAVRAAPVSEGLGALAGSQPGTLQRG